LRDLTDRDSGLSAKVESANHYVVQTLERRTRALDALLHEFKTDLLRIWIPLATGATMLIGLFAGMNIQGCVDSRPQPTLSIGSQESSAPLPPDSGDEKSMLPCISAWMFACIFAFPKI